VRAGTLLADVRAGEGRADWLYEKAEEILTPALKEKDRRTDLQAIRTAVDIMGEARGYMELRGELTNELRRDNTSPPAPSRSTWLLRRELRPNVPSTSTCCGLTDFGRHFEDTRSKSVNHWASISMVKFKTSLVISFA
jgi:hypothetical protein